jgi:hypothetical protein
MNEIRLQILNQSYWMHFKEAKDLALYYAPDHPRIILLTETIEKLRIEIEKIKK